MWVLFLDFSCRRPPPVSDHFVVHQGWSLTRDLTVYLCDIVGGTFTEKWCKRHLGGFLKTLPPNRPLQSNSFMRPKIFSKVANKKTKSTTIAFFLFSSFLSSRSFFFSFPFFASVIFELIRRKNPDTTFGPFSLERLQISLGSFSKNRLV